MNVQRRMRLSVADEQPEVHQRLGLVEMRSGLSVLPIDFHHFEFRVHEIIGDEFVCMRS